MQMQHLSTVWHSQISLIGDSQSVRYKLKYEIYSLKSIYLLLAPLSQWKSIHPVNACLILASVLCVQMRGMTPLHIAAELNSKRGVAIMEMLLTCLADPDIRALDDGSYLHLNPVFTIC